MEAAPENGKELFIYKLGQIESSIDRNMDF
jgi:hypothetical protein